MNPRIRRRTSLGLFAAALAAPRAARAQAAEYPVRGQRLSLIVGSSAGSGADITGRLAGGLIEREYPGVNVQVVNRPGAGTQVGIQALADARPDGMTIGITALPTTITLWLDQERRANFNRASFLPIANLVYDPGAIAVRAESPYRTLADLVAGAKGGRRTTVGAVGPRGREHLDIAAIEQATGAQLVPVFHNDSGLAVNSLLGGNIDAVQGSVADFLAQIRAGRLRMLAVFDRNRSGFAPDVPTTFEQGIQLETGVSRGFSFPAGTPPAMAQRIATALGRVANLPDEQKRIRDMGLEPRFMDAETYARYWDSETARITALLARLS
jgi:tripartite-type tricarboxylate transporter receptor subunit TctC